MRPPLARTLIQGIQVFARLADLHDRARRQIQNLVSILDNAAEQVGHASMAPVEAKHWQYMPKPVAPMHPHM